MSIEFDRPLLPAKIASAIFSSAKLAIFEWCSPKSFRIESGFAWLIERAFEGERDQNFWWVGPDYSAVAQALTLLRSTLTPGSFTVLGRSSALVLLNGTMMHFRSAENTNTLYSDSVIACVLDGAIHVPEKSYKALQETLANTRAPLRITSTVAGRNNWFNILAREAENASENNPNSDIIYTRFSALDAIEEGILAQSDLDYARATLPNHTFRALYLAQPYDDRIEAASKADDPRLMTDAELAIIAGFDPMIIDSIPDSELQSLISTSIQ